MDVSIVVTVEYFDPEETLEAEEAPVMAQAPGSGQPPADLETPTAEETQAIAEAPAIVEPEADTDVLLANESVAVASILPDAAAPADEGVPPVAETPAVAETAAAAEPEADTDVPLTDEALAVANIPPDAAIQAAEGVPPAIETPAIAEAPAGAEPEADTDVPLAIETPASAETRVAAGTRVAVTIPNFGEKSRVFFVFDSAAIQDDQQAMIHEWADWLKSHPGLALRIEGHTDRQGSCLYNRWLGQQRANAARDILVAQGIDASRLLAVSFGEDRPTIASASRAERSRNRRVRAEPMRLADLENYDPDLPPCASTIMARSEPSEAATAEPALAAGTGDFSRTELAEKPVREKITDTN